MSSVILNYLLLQKFTEIIRIALKSEENTIGISKNKKSIFILKTFKLQRVLATFVLDISLHIINNFFPVKFNISMDIHQDKRVESVFSHTISKVRLYITQ